MSMTVPTEQTQNGSVSLRLDAQQAFERLQSDIDLFAALDPNIAWIQEALHTRFSELPDEDAIRVTALAWPRIKAMMIPDLIPTPWPPASFPYPGGCGVWPWWIAALVDGSVPRTIIAIRHGLVEGEALRRRIEEDLAGPLTADALRKTAKEIREWEYSSDSARTRSFDEARNEVERLVAGPEDKPWAVLAVGALAGAAAMMAFEIWHHQQ
ncbi:hypothetical protein ACWCYK_31510 [Streptomyces lydicamycinicus]